MDWELPEELADLRDSVRRLAVDKVRPRARDIDETGEYPQDLFEVFAQSGLLGLGLPEAVGGGGAGTLGLCVAIEEVAKYSNAAALMLLLSRLPTGPILIGGTEAQQQRYLPDVAAGRTRAAFGLSEAQAGSDVAAMATRARRVDGGWRLRGTKCWMSGIAQADWYLVYAKSEGEGEGKGEGEGPPPSGRARAAISAFVVDRHAPGVAIGTLDRKMGVRGVDTGELILDEVFVADEDTLAVGGGFKLAMLGLNAMRPLVAARGLGLAEGALMYATEYAEGRPAFGQRVADFQGIQWEIAKIATDIEAARLLTYRAAAYVDQGRYTKAWAPYLSMAKYAATELAVRASGLAVQLLGAAGYMKDHPTELWYRDAKQLTIVEGTSQVQLGLIARGVLDRDLWWD